MASPKSAINKILKEKAAGLKTGTRAMLSILEDLRQQVISEIGRAAVESFDYHRLKQMIPAIEYQIKNFREKADLELGGLLEKHWRMGQNLVDAGLEAAGDSMRGFDLSTASLDAVKEFTASKIKGIGSEMMSRIESELHLGVLGTKTPQEVAKSVGLNLDDPSIFKSIATRAEVITQTEMGRVFSTAAQYRMQEASRHVEGLMKEWRHVGHPAVPRPAHEAANGQKVPIDKPFHVGGLAMMFPRDPRAPLSEVINCG